MSFPLFVGLVLLAAALIYVLRVGPNRHWRQGDRLQRDWQRERSQMLESLQSLEGQMRPEPPPETPPAEPERSAE